jgi:DNA-binding transcriptional ArsR family regulator
MSCPGRVARSQFVYDQNMDVERNLAATVSRIAAAIGEPGRARMLHCLMDGHARTSTELAMVAEVSPSTASVHLSRLRAARLVRVHVQGKHRYYSLEGPKVAAALEGLGVLAGTPRDTFLPSTPSRLRAARTCYDHLAGSLGVSLSDRLLTRGWLSAGASGGVNGYELSLAGTKALASLGIDIEATRALRRRFAYACLDWSERQPHVGGALAAAILGIALQRKWVIREPDSRALGITDLGRREMRTRFGLDV